MRAYTGVTGIVFGLLVVAHIARVAIEGPHVLRDVFFVASSLVALALSAWSVKLLLGGRPQSPCE